MRRCKPIIAIFIVFVRIYSKMHSEALMISRLLFKQIIQSFMGKMNINHNL